ncbi:aminotransferase class I/II-fold pyridoxal phosphate-dependent enzyme [Bacillus spongiae]|uniref:Aminotransferase class I/II-fold pyridoxal phosphate-dependent enzyme n=1 Tax=Bacillus spongiae TaxID=2683610 RepID=A0ABU8HE72_9BACI
MQEMSPFVKAFQQTKFRLNGHGKREVGVLKEALLSISNQQESDIYGTGQVIEAFQRKMANYLGKESAVFFPSGTMAQQIALRIWCDEKGMQKVAYHPLCHLEIHEEDGLKELHHIDPILLADKDRLIELDDILNINEEIACLLLELPQREIGGQLPEYSTLEAISSYCKEKGIKLHLDGARLFEITPYYGKSASEICKLFDSVYISFYKGIGGVAGAILAGDESFTESSKVWKRRHGGDLVSLYPYILSADYYFEQRVNSMKNYYEGAKELAQLYNDCHQITTKPIKPVSNMFHVHLFGQKEHLEKILMEIHHTTGIGFTPYLREVTDHEYFYEVSIGDQYAAVPREEVKKAFSLLNKRMKELDLSIL